MPSAFDEVVTESFLPWPTSPAIEDDVDFRGLRIAAPEVVAISPSDRAPPRVVVCGAHRLDVGTLGIDNGFEHLLSVVAVDATTHEPFVGPVVSDAPEPDPAPSEPLYGATLTEYWNFDLAENLSLPARAADYFVYAVLGPLVSNVVRVSLREPEETP